MHQTSAPADSKIADASNKNVAQKIEARTPHRTTHFTATNGAAEKIDER